MKFILAAFAALTLTTAAWAQAAPGGLATTGVQESSGGINGNSTSGAGTASPRIPGAVGSQRIAPDQPVESHLAKPKTQPTVKR